MTSSSGCLSIAMSLGCRCESVKCTSVTRPAALGTRFAIRHLTLRLQYLTPPRSHLSQGGRTWVAREQMRVPHSRLTRGWICQDAIWRLGSSLYPLVPFSEAIHLVSVNKALVL